MISQINKYIIRSGDEFLILFSYFINIQSGQRSLQTGSYDYPDEWTGRPPSPPSEKINTLNHLLAIVNSDQSADIYL